MGRRGVELWAEAERDVGMTVWMLCILSGNEDGSNWHVPNASKEYPRKHVT